MVGRRNAVRTRTVDMWLGEDGIARIIVLPNTSFTIEDNRENTKLAQQVFAGQKRPVYADLRHMTWSDREARNSTASEEVAQLFSAVAMHVASPVERIIVMFFVRISRPPYPVQMFTSEASALQWLRQFIQG